jgi:hypothetical protein
MRSEIPGSIHRWIMRCKEQSSGKLLGKAVPLAAGPKPEDARVPGSTLVDVPTARFLWRVVLGKDRLDLLTQLLRCAPDGGQRLVFGGALGPRFSSVPGIMVTMLPDRERFEIVRSHLIYG